jgi:hypothetical protein
VAGAAARPAEIPTVIAVAALTRLTRVISWVVLLIVFSLSSVCRGAGSGSLRSPALSDRHRRR